MVPEVEATLKEHFTAVATTTNAADPIGSRIEAGATRAVKRYPGPNEHLIGVKRVARFSRGKHVKRIFLRIAAILIASAAITLLSSKGFAATVPAGNTDLNSVVKWGVWHEGCRIYAADNSLGDVEQIRACLVTVYGQNESAQRLLRSASKNTLGAAIRLAASEIPNERQIERFLEYACKDKGLLENFRKLAEVNDYDALRGLYFENFQGFAEIRNLLAAVSDRDLAYAVKQLELTQNTNEVPGD